ncbi:3-hydroxyacyl-CoA dehydrogenase [Pleurocapsa sp. PCC 7319]|uniref:3-hydroxyacyl-CoA dehydrogenase n=1 Tax=Pleurocapsa sp. PCC 7319 TaxID=118161 RepID=UPI000345DDF0|nr:3-hydroxyacyl-CoA dehydrogenase [Pleurocapsa sp. PCC 7319]
MEIKNVVVAGGGVMGSQVAWQTAWHDFNVTVYDAFDKGIERCKKFHETYSKEFIDKRGASEGRVNQAKQHLSYTTNLEEAAKDADLIIEQVPEDLEIKQKFWEDASKYSPEKTIFTTNTSSLLPSDMVQFVDRPEKFLTLHFCVPVWDANIGEVMAQSKTEDKYYDIMLEYAEKMGLVPIAVKKEQPGYILNSLLIPFGLATVDLVRRGVADHESIDKVWRICNKSDIGPCQMIDMTGMNVNYHVLKSWGETKNDQKALDAAEYIQSEFIDKGHLGVESGQGFYSYPNPSFEDEDFLKTT